MAFDMMRGTEGGRDWSCGIGDAAPPRVPIAAIFAAGAVAIGATVAGLFAASSIGGRAHAPHPAMGPPTMILEPMGGGGTHGRYYNKLGR